MDRWMHRYLRSVQEQARCGTVSVPQTPEVTWIKYLQGSQKLSAATANFKPQNKHSPARERAFFFLPYLVFRRSSIFLQHLERVNNQEHAAGGAGKGPENMGVRQGNGQMLAGFPTCRGGRWGRLTPHRDSELLQWFGLTGGWGDLQGPAGLGKPPRPLGWGTVQGLAETCHSTRRDAGHFSPPLIHQESRPIF